MITPAFPQSPVGHDFGNGSFKIVCPRERSAWERVQANRVIVGNPLGVAEPKLLKTMTTTLRDKTISSLNR